MHKTEMSAIQYTIGVCVISCNLATPILTRLIRSFYLHFMRQEIYGEKSANTISITDYKTN